MDHNVIIYKNEKTGGVVVISPSLGWLKRTNFDYEGLAKRRVPEGLDYKIINIKDLPESREYRQSWKYPENDNKIKECPECYKKSLKDFVEVLDQRPKKRKIGLKERLQNKIKNIDNCQNFLELKQIENQMKEEFERG